MARNRLRDKFRILRGAYDNAGIGPDSDRPNRSDHLSDCQGHCLLQSLRQADISSVTVYRVVASQEMWGASALK